MKILKFIAISYILTIFLGIFMAYGYYTGKSIDLFAATFMLMPTLAVFIVTKTYKDTYFHKIYLVATLIISVLCVSSVFISNTLIPVIHSWAGIILSIILWIALYKMNNEKKEEHKLLFKKNFLKGLLYVFLYIIIIILILNISNLIETGKFAGLFSIKEFILCFFLPIDFFLSFIIFFGEEYAWRYYLQTKLQEKYGLRLGVLMVGVIWALWHLPLNIFYYSPETSLQSIVLQIIGCIGISIYFGLVYMKTQNIWIVSLLHCMHNSILITVLKVSPSNNIISWNNTLTLLITYSIVYIPILLLFYKKKDNKDKI